MCFDVSIEIMTQNCLKSRHYQESFLKHRARASLNAGVSTYIIKNISVNLLCVKTKIHFE